MEDELGRNWVVSPDDISAWRWAQDTICRSRHGGFPITSETVRACSKQSPFSSACAHVYTV